jgi:methionine sulfoxide reductase heme-binding subunit
MGALTAAVDTKALWYLTRGSGIVSLLLLTASVVLGVTVTARWATRHWPRFVVEGLHKNISLLSIVFLGVHIVTAIADGYVPIRWLDVVVPFGSHYQPLWLGLGALAFDCLIAVAITSMLRVRVGHRVWRGVHWLAYACWPLAIVHGLGIGSDTAQAWMQVLNVAAAAAVVDAVVWRLTLGTRQPTPAVRGVRAA